MIHRDDLVLLRQAVAGEAPRGAAELSS